MRSTSSERAGAADDSGPSGCPVAHHVGDDESCREEDQAEDEVAEEAMTLSSGDPGRPERDSDPDRERENRPQPPSVCGKQHLDLLRLGRTQVMRVWCGAPSSDAQPIERRGGRGTARRLTSYFESRGQSEPGSRRATGARLDQEDVVDPVTVGTRQPPTRSRDAPPHRAPSRSSSGCSDRARHSRSSGGRAGRAVGRDPRRREPGAA